MRLWLGAMGEFLKSEKTRQASFRTGSPYFSDAARADGIYKGKAYPFCLPREHAEENLFPGIRESALAYFAAQRIKWHDGQGGKASNHLCTSQVCCVNFLFPFADEPRALAEVLRPAFPDIREMLPIESGRYVACEWIGQENYLSEKIHRGDSRTRGANFTSADSAVMFERTDGKRQIGLIEWKYTESYGGMFLKTAKNGTDRTAIYNEIFERDDCPIDKSLLPSFDALFYEPFYQFMRQQFLAHEMERAHELGADQVSVLHIAPGRNSEFQKVTSPQLRALSDTATGVWKRLVRPAGRFVSISTEQLFGRFSAAELPRCGHGCTTSSQDTHGFERARLRNLKRRWREFRQLRWPGWGAGLAAAPFRWAKPSHIAVGGLGLARHVPWRVHQAAGALMSFPRFRQAATLPTERNTPSNRNTTSWCSPPMRLFSWISSAVFAGPPKRRAPSSLLRRPVSRPLCSRWSAT
jgi:hypothetical protein